MRTLTRSRTTRRLVAKDATGRLRPIAAFSTDDPTPAERLPMTINAAAQLAILADALTEIVDLATTAAAVRRAIGVSPDAWAQALEVMGEHDTSIVIAAILQRGDEIKSAGGYLRVLTAKARAGEFSLGPVLMALLRGKAAKTARERKRAG